MPNIIGKGDENWVPYMREVKEALDATGAKYWADTGTLLGGIREGKVIGWDNDIDFSTKAEEASKIVKALPGLAAKGWRIDVADEAVYLLLAEQNLAVSVAFYHTTGDKIWIPFGVYREAKLNFAVKHLYRMANRMPYNRYDYGVHPLEKALYAILPGFLKTFLRRLFFGIVYGLGRAEYALMIPKRLVDTLGTMPFYGIQMPIPTPPEEYLAAVYGDDWRVPKKNWKWTDMNNLDYDFYATVDRSSQRLPI